MQARHGPATTAVAGLALNGWILLPGQIPFTAARDGLFPKPFTRQTEELVGSGR